MGFWNYLGLAIVARHFFGRKNTRSAEYDALPNQDIDHDYDYDSCMDQEDSGIYRDRLREAELGARVDDMSRRISQLEQRLGEMDPYSPEYESLHDDLEDIRDDFDDLETDME